METVEVGMDQPLVYTGAGLLKIIVKGLFFLHTKTLMCSVQKGKGL